MNTSTIILNDAKFTESFGRSKSTFIKRLHFWINKAETKMNSIGIVHEGKRWIYNTAEEWGKQIGYSERQTQRIISDLIKDKVILLEKLGRYKKTNTNFYTLNYEKLTELDLATTSAPKETLKTNKEINAVTTATNTVSTGTKSHKHSKPLNTTVQDMHAIWNSTFPNNQTSMTKDLGRYLYAAHKNSFNYNMKEWEKYCLTLSAQNPNGLSIETALKFNTLNHYKNTQNQVSTQTYQGQVSQGAICSAISTQLPESKIDISKSQEMLDIWNRIFEEKKSIVSMTPRLSTLLAQSLKENFNSDLNHFKNYCKSIATSPTMMKKEFKIHITTWATNKYNIKRIYDKDMDVRKIFIPEPEYIDIVTPHIEMMKLEEDSFLNHVRKIFIKIYGEASYISWIMPATMKIKNRELIIESTPFMMDYININFTRIFDYVRNNAPTKNGTETTQNISKPEINKSCYTKKKKIFERYYPHDIKKKFVFYKDGSINKENIILRYGFTLNGKDKSDDTPLITSYNQDIIYRIPTEEERGGGEKTHTETLPSLAAHKNLSKPDDSQKTNDVAPVASINVALGLASTKPQYKIENFTLIESIHQINRITLNHKYFYEAKKSTPEFTTTNVVKSHPPLRQNVVLHYTVITNKHNNNLIRATSLTHDQIDFTNPLNESNHQVRNYYLKNINYKEEFQKQISQSKQILRGVRLSKEESPHQSQRHPQRIHGLKSNTSSDWRARTCDEIQNQSIGEVFFWNLLLERIKRYYLGIRYLRRISFDTTYLDYAS